MTRYACASTLLATVSSLIFLGFVKTGPSLARPTLAPSKRILGVAAHANPNYELMKQAGIGWVRLWFSFPFEDKIGGKRTPSFLKNVEQAKEVRKLGLQIMGVSPLPGIITNSAVLPTGDARGLFYGAVPPPLTKVTEIVWAPQIPAWAGPTDSDSYYQTYEKACEELGRQTKGIVDIWQVGNEMNLHTFTGSLTFEQVKRFVLEGARGLKSGNPQAKVSINATPGASGEALLRDLYRKDTPLDYSGVDAYFGSSQPGGPQDWVPLIDKVHELTGKPVLIHEWGYSSLQGSGIPLRRKVANSVCQNQAWKYVWRNEHSPEEQAAYVQTGMKIFATYPNVAGCFFYDWGDDPVCYHCGAKGCPAECGWGLVDSQGKPKPAYYALKAMAKEFF